MIRWPFTLLCRFLFVAPDAKNLALFKLSVSGRLFPKPNSMRLFLARDYVIHL